MCNCRNVLFTQLAMTLKTMNYNGDNMQEWRKTGSINWWRGIKATNPSGIGGGDKEGDNVFKSINQNMHVGGIFCNLAKALGCVNYEILLDKSHFYGIQGVSEEKSPNSTKIFFCWMGYIETWSSQAQLLGPLLFIIHI